MFSIITSVSSGKVHLSVTCVEIRSTYLPYVGSKLGLGHFLFGCLLPLFLDHMVILCRNAYRQQGVFSLRCCLNQNV